MTGPDRSMESAPKRFDWRRPPAWFGLLIIPVAVLAAFALTEKHGPVLGVLAGIVYASLALVPLALDQVTSWSKAHPFLDSLILLPLLFFALAYLTQLPLIACMWIAAACAVPWLALTTFLRKRRQARSA
ncbi:hypothetical protein OG589_38225 [Sphaerisporangium sp. NBC_01403]|uniref:hypothetical protein n=1 Tax=Sphaerisporangium sp. NBC_01403 TaxID=2903599 RepID=UPI003251F360